MYSCDDNATEEFAPLHQERSQAVICTTEDDRLLHKDVGSRLNVFDFSWIQLQHGQGSLRTYIDSVGLNKPGHTNVFEGVLFFVFLLGFFL